MWVGLESLRPHSGVILSLVASHRISNYGRAAGTKVFDGWYRQESAGAERPGWRERHLNVTRRRKSVRSTSSGS